jgi:response regulator of citrate/malate metabolism
MQTQKREKNDFQKNIEEQILCKIFSFLEKNTKAKLILLSKKEIAAEIGISVISLVKYLTKMDEIEVDK